MLRFLAHRLLLGLVVLWIVSVAVFVLFFVTPHDPARLIAGRLATPQTVALVNHRLGLDRPLPDQYGGFVWRALHGDLGYSYYSSAPVRQLLASRLPVTVSLVLGAAVLWLVLGVGVGVAAARRPRSVTDRAGTVFVLTGLSMPTFLVGLLLIYFLFFRLHLAGVDLFPAGGYVPLSQDPAGWAQHLLLPWITLAVVIAATYSRLTRSSLLEVLGQALGPGGPRACPRSGSSTGTASAAPSPRWSPSSASTSAACSAGSSSPSRSSACPASASLPGSRSPTRTCRSSSGPC